MDWIAIENPKSKSDFGFGLSIQFCHFNPNPKYNNYFIKKLKFHMLHAKLLLIKKFKPSVRLELYKRCLFGIPWFHHKTWPFNICCPKYFSKLSWIVIEFELDCQSILKIGFGWSITNLGWIWIRALHSVIVIFQIFPDFNEKKQLFS